MLSLDKSLSAKDKEALILALREVELMNNTNKTVNIDFDPQNPNEQVYDELARKQKLLEQRNQIIENSQVQIWKQLYFVFNIIAILSMSGMQFGYGICQITSVYDQRALMKNYNFDIPLGIGIGLMVGLMPVGAFFGQLFSTCLFQNISIKNRHHINNVICMISSFCFMQINFLSTLLIGRFIYGWCIANYCIDSPLYIEQIVPLNLKNFARSVNSMWVIGAIMLGYLLGLVFYENEVGSYYRIMFCIPGAIALIQLIFMLIFVPDSPTELFDKQLYEQGRKVLQKIYNPQFVDSMVDKYKLQSQVKALRITSKISQIQLVNQNGRLWAKIMDLFLHIYREFVGTNTILIYGGIFVGQFNSDVGPYASFALTLITFMTTIASHICFNNRCGRKILMLLSAIIFAICNFVIMTGQVLESYVMIFASMAVFLILFGSTYSIVYSIYPAQILGDEKTNQTSLATWVAMIISTMVPPMLSDVVTPSHTAWPIFLFYGAFSIFSVAYLWFCAVQSKGKKYRDILKQF